jgi:hypothetical protein
MQVARLYRPGVMLNLAKLAACAALHFVSMLSASAVCWLNAICAVLTGRLYRESARPYYSEPAAVDPETRRALLKYIAPLVPATVFYAFQGQIQIWLISTFGKDQNIAEITALGRLGQVFLVLISFNATLLTPFIARVPFARIAMRYAQAVLLILGIAGTITAAAYLFPNLFLMLLGPKYMNLRRELGLSVLASSISFAITAVYSMNNARRWNFQWVGIATIVGILAIQTALVAVMDLSTTYNVLIFSAIPSAYALLVLFVGAVAGYRRDCAENAKQA